MKWHARSIILILLGTVCGLRVSYAQKIVVTPEPAWRLPVAVKPAKISLREVSDGYYESFMETQQHVELEAVYYHEIREIVSNEGVQNGSQIAVSFDPSYERLEFHRVVVRRKGRETNQLNPSKFKIVQNEEEMSSFVYNGTKKAYLILEDVRSGDQIEFSYTLIGRNPIFNGRFSSSYYFHTYAPTGQVYKNLIVSTKRALHFRAFNNAPTAKVSEKNGLRMYEWNTAKPVVYKEEEFEPSWFEPYPYIQLSEYKEWKEVIQWALPLYASANTLPPALKPKVDEWKKIIKNDRFDYLDLVTRYVQDEIRYMGIEMGEYSHRPNSPERVFRQRFGDCKDKSLLLCTLLRAMGIEAYPALVNTYKREHLVDRLPSPYAFNHVIVMAKIDDSVCWIDPTISYQRGSVQIQYLSPYGKALVIRPNEAQLTDIPHVYPGVAEITEKYTVPALGQPAKLEVNSKFSIANADNMRSLFAQNGIMDLEKSYTDFYAELFPKSAVTMSDSIFFKDDESHNVFTINERYQIDSIWQRPDSTKKMLALDINAQILKGKLLFLSKKGRKTPIALNFPYELYYQIEVQFPEPWTIEPADFTLKRDAYEFEIEELYDQSTFTWTIKYHYKVLKPWVAANQATQFIADMDKINESLAKTITWNPELTQQTSAVLWWMVGLAMALLAGFSVLAIRFSQRPAVGFSEQEPLDIGGWLIVIALGLWITPVLICRTLLSNNYFNQLVWVGLEGNANELFIKALWLGELIFNLFLLVFSVLVLYLFLKKRVNLPKVLTVFMVVYLVFVGGEWVVCMQFKEVFEESTIESLRNDFVLQLFRSVIWIPYLNKSERVKQTFVTTAASQEFAYSDISELPKEEEQ